MYVRFEKLIQTIQLLIIMLLTLKFSRNGIKIIIVVNRELEYKPYLLYSQTRQLKYKFLSSESYLYTGRI